MTLTNSFVSVPLPRDNKTAYIPLDAMHLFPNTHAWRWNDEAQNLVDEKTKGAFPLDVNHHDEAEVFFRGAVHPRGVMKHIQTFLSKFRV